MPVRTTVIFWFFASAHDRPAHQPELLRLAHAPRALVTVVAAAIGARWRSAGGDPYRDHCGVSMPVRRIQQGYSDRVRRRLKDDRPKWNAAVKSLSAFVDGDNELFEVLVGHLNAVCDEAISKYRLTQHRIEE